jgi:guanylate kinase
MSSKLLYVLSGASGSGKSSLLKMIVEKGLCKQAPKYANRANRVNEFDDITHIEIDDLIKKCDLRYQIYNKSIWYGINTNEIKEKLQYDDLVVIISDITTIKKLKEH